MLPPGDSKRREVGKRQCTQKRSCQDWRKPWPSCPSEAMVCDTNPVQLFVGQLGFRYSGYEHYADQDRGDTAGSSLRVDIASHRFVGGSLLSLQQVKKSCFAFFVAKAVKKLCGWHERTSFWNGMISALSFCALMMSVRALVGSSSAGGFFVHLLHSLANPGTTPVPIPDQLPCLDLEVSWHWPSLGLGASALDFLCGLSSRRSSCPLRLLI